MQIFHVKSNGEVHEITDESKPIKEFLDTKESYILSDDESRVVYLWKGKESKVRSKFIGARKLQDLRSQVGLNYRSESIDEVDVEAGEYTEFSTSIQESRHDGFAQEIREEGDELKFKIGNNDNGSKPKTYSQLMNSKYNQNIKQTGPLYTGGTGSKSEKISHHESSFTEDDLEKIIDILDADEIPEGFKRELVIIGEKSYSVTEKVQTFLGKKTVEHKLEQIDTLPEGVFFAEGYIPRVLVQNHKVIAIEFLKKT